MIAAYAGVERPAWSLSSCDGSPMSRLPETHGDGTFLSRSLTGTRAQYAGLERAPRASGVATAMAAS